jgi:hypothetical protein
VKNSDNTPKDDFIEFLLSQFSNQLQKDLIGLILKNPSDNENIVKEIIKKTRPS